MDGAGRLWMPKRCSKAVLPSLNGMGSRFRAAASCMQTSIERGPQFATSYVQKLICGAHCMGNFTEREVLSLQRIKVL